MKRVLLLIRHWHRWLGIAVVLPALVLVITGMVLNHVDSLGLARSTLPVWMAEAYGVPVASGFEGAPLGDRWLARVGEELYLDDQPVAECAGAFAGVVMLSARVVAGCGSDLVLLDADGKLLEQVSASWGVPRFDQLGSAADRLVLMAGDSKHYFSLDTLQAEPVDEGSAVVTALRQPLPPGLSARLRAHAVPAEMNWERFMLDLHGGRLFGRFGWVLVDFAGFALLVLMVTGTVMWYRAQKRLHHR